MSLGGGRGGGGDGKREECRYCNHCNNQPCDAVVRTHSQGAVKERLVATCSPWCQAVFLLHRRACRFVGGGVPGNSSKFVIGQADWHYMESCDNIVVLSAVFGEADTLRTCLS